MKSSIRRAARAADVVWHLLRRRGEAWRVERLGSPNGLLMDGRRPPDLPVCRLALGMRDRGEATRYSLFSVTRHGAQKSFATEADIEAFYAKLG